MITSREDWLEARLNGIGGSEAPVIYNGSVYDRTIMDLYLEKRRIVEPPDISHKPDIQRGNWLESIVAKIYAKEHGVDVDAPLDKVDQWNRFFHWSDEHPFMFANIDFRIRGAKVMGEIKCPRVRGFMKVSREGLHEHYLLQVMHDMAVTGDERCVFLVFSAEMWKLHVEIIERDEALISKIIDANRAFWDCVERGQPPVHEAPGSKEKVTAKSEKMPDAGDSEIVRLETPDFSSAVKQYQEAQDLIAEVTEIKNEAKKQAIDLMGKAEIAEGGGCRVFHKEVPGRKTLDKKALQANHPDIDLKKFEKVGKPFRQFRIFNTSADAE